jgi:hypothetical protein
LQSTDLPLSRRSVPWDPELHKPTLQWPRLVTSDPYVVQEVVEEWKVVSDVVPLQTITHRRGKFFGHIKPEKVSPVYSGTICSHCRKDIYGPLFVCSRASCDFIWCWSCMTDPDNEHDCKHSFVRFDGEYGSNLTRRKYAVVYGAKVKRESSVVVAGPSKPAEQTSRSSWFRESLKHFASSYPSHSRSSSNTSADNTKQTHQSPSNVDQDIIFEVAAEAKYDVSLLASSVFIYSDHCSTDLATQQIQFSPWGEHIHLDKDHH